jgi:hypothetical protein
MDKNKNRNRGRLNDLMRLAFKNALYEGIFNAFDDEVRLFTKREDVKKALANLAKVWLKAIGEEIEKGNGS